MPNDEGNSWPCLRRLHQQSPQKSYHYLSRPKKKSTVCERRGLHGTGRLAAEQLSSKPARTNTSAPKADAFRGTVVMSTRTTAVTKTDGAHQQKEAGGCTCSATLTVPPRYLRANAFDQHDAPQCGPRFLRTIFQQFEANGCNFTSTPR
jgi:hypothetical protein